MGHRFLAIVLLGILLTGCDKQPPARPTSAPATQPTAARMKLPAFGIEFTPPPGWTEVTPGELGVIAEWTRGKSTIAIKANRDVKSVDATAIEFAQEFGGKVDSLAMSIAGERAMRVNVAPAIDKPEQPLHAIVVERRTYQYMVIGCDTEGRSCAAEVEALARSFAWVPVEHPSAHLQFRDKPLMLFDEALSLNVPRIMWTQDLDPLFKLPGIGMGIFDMDNIHAEMVVTMYLIQADTTRQARQLSPKALEAVEKNLGPQQPFKLEPRAGHPEISFTPFLDVQALPGRPWLKTRARVGWIKLTDVDSLLCLVLVHPRNPDDMQTYMKVGDQIVESIEVHAKAVAVSGGQRPLAAR